MRKEIFTDRRLIKFGIIAIVIALLSLVTAVVAQSGKHHEEITGIATVTVTTGGGGGGGGGGGTTCTPADPVYDFEPDQTTVDFSGEVSQGGQYIATRTLSIENTSVAGTSSDCSAIPATISSISTSASGMATGWTLTTDNPVGFPLDIGETGSVDLILTGPADQQETAVLEFSITLSAD